MYINLKQAGNLCGFYEKTNNNRLYRINSLLKKKEINGINVNKENRII